MAKDTNKAALGELRDKILVLERMLVENREKVADHIAARSNGKNGLIIRHEGSVDGSPFFFLIGVLHGFTDRYIPWYGRTFNIGLARQNGQGKRAAVQVSLSALRKLSK